MRSCNFSQKWLTGKNEAATKRNNPQHGLTKYENNQYIKRLADKNSIDDGPDMDADAF